MALILLTCVLFSLGGLILASFARVEPGKQRQREKLSAAAIALAGGLITIGLISRRYRPGGGHARGVMLELTTADVRLWGRGYGTRIAYDEIAVSSYSPSIAFRFKVSISLSTCRNVTRGDRTFFVARP